MAVYAVVSGIIGLIVPVAYITEGFFLSDKESIKPAVPHLFLLLCQIFMEGVGFSDKFSLPIRVYVPVVYNSVRIFTLMEWLRDEFTKGTNGGNGASSSSSVRIFVGRSIAVSNMVFWCFNLFGFLLPVWLPKIFKLYYSAPAVLHKVKT
ncbi:Transmembrane protein [Heracleum sosnowskyi]|uniref:Transmembrane protein n=1 Tax=Heracleum sosnowskyi TaxID=360622 RepID=A0AAD8JBL7_9APIA|nr:Transmembrane protein [Heracleum sosnowskyi]